MVVSMDVVVIAVCEFIRRTALYRTSLFCFVFVCAFFRGFFSFYFLLFLVDRLNFINCYAYTGSTDVHAHITQWTNWIHRTLLCTTGITIHCEQFCLSLSLSHSLLLPLSRPSSAFITAAYTQVACLLRLNFMFRFVNVSELAFCFCVRFLYYSSS